MTASHPVTHVDVGNPRPVAVSSGCALFLDVDGCLLEFALDPAAIRATPRIIAALDALSRRLDGALALVSGRTLAAIDEIFAPAKYTAVGLHGLEHRGMPAQRERDPRLADIVAEADVMFGGRTGVFIEDKGRSLALHWRAAPVAEPLVRAFAARALARLPGYCLEPGNMVVELRPRGADKGSAIRQLMMTPVFAGRTPVFAGRTPVFAGDDLTDEPGFIAVNAMGGISVLIGNRADSVAIHRLADPADVLSWLEQAP